MKKILYIVSIAAMVLLASCKKDPVGATATVDLAGQWMVQVDIVDENGEVVIEDFNEGRSMLLTYNTADNTPDAMYINDMNNFWNFTLVVPCNVASLSFGKDESTFLDNEAYPCGVAIWGGKVVFGGAKTPSGAPADYIEFFCNFDDDDLASEGLPGVSYPEYFHGVAYKVSGYRYTGLVADEE